MVIDEQRLRALWERQRPPPALARDVLARIKRHRRLAIARRAIEMALTLAAIGLFVWSSWIEGLSPRQLLLIPFFSVFLIVSWTVSLQQPLGAQMGVTERVAIYAKMRQLQVRGVLRNLKFAERSAIVLLFYAAIALGGALLFGTAAWQSAGGVLLVWSALWYAGTRWLVTRRRRALRREYRAMGRLV